MNGKENIINKILSDADARCEEIISSAHTRANALVEETREQVTKDREALDAKLSLNCAERERNAISNAELDAKKYRLNAKQALIARCYDEVHERLARLNDEDRLDLIGALIEKHSERGETVYVTAKDARLVTQLWLNGFERGLKLGNRRIVADGGIVLEGEGYEKDLTLNSVVRYLREQTETQVATLLGVRDE